MVGNFKMIFIWFCLISYSYMMRTSTSLDSLAMSQSIRDGETLISADGSFELGFFSPGNSARRYLGVWYRDISGNSTIVWVANRETPLQNTSGVLKFNEEGKLQLLNGTNSAVWSSNVSSKAVNNPVAQLLDSGNLVVKNGPDSNADNFLWQSFDYPTDTMLPGMKLGWDLITGTERFVSCWKSEDDPAVGEHSVKIDPRGYPQLFKWKGPVIKTRVGSWNGLSFTGYPVHEFKIIFTDEFVVNEKEVYYEYQSFDRSIYSIYRFTHSGSGQRLSWKTKTRSLQEVFSRAWQDPCENYALCGSNSICNMNGNVPTCECLKGYVPKFPEQFNISYWSNDCVPRNKADCKNTKTDGFWRYTNMKLPDTSSSWFSATTDLEECRVLCLKNCSCTAYASLDIRNGGSGCIHWSHSLIDLRLFSQGGDDLYVRVPASELDYAMANGHGNKKKLVGIAVVGVIILGLTICAYILINKKRGVARIIYKKHYENILKNEEIYLPTFDLAIIATATDNFSSSNKLREGGFGPVYKGTLADGKELAVKRLSENSGQGLEEFKNEVVLIAKLQHRNLVKLLGCCIEREEIMLVYEYMPNKSVDNFIFDETRRKLLDWPKRFKIISGIARGLLYLHEDSRLRIVHRDLKTSNILLDANLDLKTSNILAVNGCCKGEEGT